MTVRTLPASAGWVLTHLFMRGRYTQCSLAAAMGVPQRKVRDLCNDRIPIAEEIAGRLVRAFPETTTETWLFTQRRADAFRAQFPDQDPRKPMTLSTYNVMRVRESRSTGLAALARRVGVRRPSVS